MHYLDFKYLRSKMKIDVKFVNYSDICSLIEQIHVFSEKCTAFIFNLDGRSQRSLRFEKSLFFVKKIMYITFSNVLFQVNYMIRTLASVLWIGPKDSDSFCAQTQYGLMQGVSSCIYVCKYHFYRRQKCLIAF